MLKLQKSSLLLLFLGAIISVMSADIQPIAKASDSIPVAVDQAAAPVVRNADEKTLDLDNAARLPPMPLFMPSLFDTIKMLNPQKMIEDVINKNKPSSGDEAALPIDNGGLSADSSVSLGENNEKKRHGVLTILLFKSINKNSEQAIDNKPDEQVKTENALNTDEVKNQPDSFVNSKLLLFRILPKKILSIFGGDDSSSADTSEQTANEDTGFPEFHPQLIGGDDLDKKRVHLFGGPDDKADHQFNFKFGGNNDPDHLKAADDSDSLSNSVDTDANKFMFKGPSILSFFHFRQRPPMTFKTDDGASASLSDDIGQNAPQAPPQHVKKCMMLSFMRLKASIYYRTIIHLLFVSGIIMLAMFMLLLSVRVYKRRRTMRFYTHNMNIATIDATNDELKKQPLSGSNRSLLFQFGTSAQQQKEQEALGYTTVDPKSSLLLSQSPPSYEQLVKNMPESVIRTKSRSSLINSLASAYKIRFTQLKNSNVASQTASSSNEEDNKSISSLPAYEENLSSSKKDNSQI